LPIFFSSGKVFCGFKLNLAFYNNTVPRCNIYYKKLILKEYFLRLVQTKFRLLMGDTEHEPRIQIQNSSK